ncbi:Ig-like domain-containing protein [Croceitalea rosinachiae]|uniref:Ig-like domain-containing protein n=1 Tax=Croceitalea rosinachiae TaxID=3075596 RepID=A0ABU3AC94_9FLAO|nr:Ig-like domain-containing protein [Croceitalea sp. F388]MDT0607806.1 Ig-like domain-containing protein [Croceitalea sp. F388]
MKILTPHLTVILMLFFCNIITSQSTISGELKKWHTVTLSFNGPMVTETDDTNPFLEYRLNVTFTSPSGKTWLVPGFYAADGNAAQSSSSSGNVWQVRFTPNETGSWSYSSSFRTGNNIAVSLDNNAGSPTFFDGDSGNFSISASNKNIPDNRAKGRLNYIGEHYLQFEETNEYFIKAGSDSPENMLAFGDFDNTKNSKNWSPHIGDWQTGNPTWGNEKGKGLIGAINYLSNKGMNAFSFLTMNVKGDGKDVWPWIAANNGDFDGDSGNDANNRLRYDVSKLEQWEILFSHADAKGMFLHFKTQETENDQLLDGGELGTQRKLYYRELIARFGHHLVLNWNMGEENTQTDNQRKEMAEFFKDLDPYGHHIVIHTYPNQQNQVYNPLLGNASEYTGPSIQSGINNIHNDVKKWVIDSRNSGKKWVVANDEQGGAQVGVAADANYSGDKGSQGDNRNDVRDKVLWGTLMAGGSGVEYYFGYGTGETDLTAQDFRSRDTKWSDAKIAIDFFKENIPFWEMQSDDGLTSDNNDYCFVKDGEVYLVYLPDGGSANLDLSNVNGTFSIKWFDPRNGGNLNDGSVTEITGGGNKSIGNPPSNDSSDWTVLIEKTSDDGDGNDDSDMGDNSDGNCNVDYVENDGLVVIEVENLEVGNGWVEKNSISGFSGTSYLEWEGGDNFNSPGIGLITTQIQINSPGTYLFRWRSKVGEGNNSTESNDSWLRFPDADDFFGEKNNGSIVYPNGSGKTPNPNGSSSDGWFKVFLSGTTDWTWSTNTSDNDSHKIYVSFDKPGTYTLEIAGRSNHHLLDRIVLSNDFANATDLSLEESICNENTGGEAVAVSSISLSPENPTITIDDSLELIAEVLPANATNKAITWSSGDGTIAIVNDDGTVTGVSEGTVTITVTTEDGSFTSESLVTVISGMEAVAVSSISLSPENPTIAIDASLELIAEVLPANATNKAVSWSSDDETIATVDDNGTVTGVSEGTVTIIVTTEDGNFVSESFIAIITNDIAEGVKVYPNPALSNTNVNIVGIENGTYEMALYSLSGSLVLQKTIEIKGNYNISLNNLTEGLYLLNLRNIDNLYVEKIFIR